MSREKFEPRYSGPLRSGICICGHGYEAHHLGMVLNADYLHQTHEIYLPQECEFYGFNSEGGLGPDGSDHCHNYRDSKAPKED